MATRASSTGTPSRSAKRAPGLSRPMLDMIVAGAALTGLVSLASGGAVASPEAAQPARPSEAGAQASAPVKMSLVAAVSAAAQPIGAQSAADQSFVNRSFTPEPAEAQPAPPPIDTHHSAGADAHLPANNHLPTHTHRPAANLHRSGLVVHRSGVVHGASFGHRSASSAVGGQRVIMIIRHGEKPGKGGGHGLTAAGFARAQGLTSVFSGSRFAAPRAIFAAGATGKGRGQRTRETVGPLASRLGVPVNTSFGKGQEAALARAATARSANGPVLISWQHGEIPAIAKALHVVGGTPKGWGKKDFDGVWKFTWTPRGWVFSSGSEGLGGGKGGGKHGGKHHGKH